MFLKKLKFIENKLLFLGKHLSIVFVFAFLYYLSETYLVFENKKDEITEHMSLLDCFHFSLVTQTTVGYGHIYPTNPYSRMINILQLLTIFYSILT